ncbi:MAG TPA: hypothetical protein VFJ86_01150 [Usitatibacter sp.]|nr:hypothetical protein [Usitatibacter sp.]
MQEIHRSTIQSRGTASPPLAPIDAALAARAVAMALPLIERAMRDPSFGDSGFLHIVVMDPQAVPSETAFEDAILHEHSVGDRAKWDADYAMYARGKARESWTTGADNPKGAVCLDGLVVGASGAFEPFDQAYAGTVAMCLRALARHRSS